MHPLVSEVVGDYLARVEGLGIEGLYLEGSVALDDFHPHSSDIDFVAVTAGPLSPAALAALDRVHERLRSRRRRPSFDGFYLTRADLTDGPAGIEARPTSHEGRFDPRSGRPGPVTWHTLATHGVVCRGPAAADLDLWTDADALAAWQAANLDTYWTRWLRGPASLRTVSAYGAAWVVTGVSRIHYTLATGGITSKSGAAWHALRIFPDRWRRVVEESLRIREGGTGRSRYRSPLARRRDVVAFGEMVIADVRGR